MFQLGQQEGLCTSILRNNHASSNELICSYKKKISQYLQKQLHFKTHLEINVVISPGAFF